MTGLFCELSLDPNDPSLKDHLAEKPQLNESEIVAYLKAGKLLVASPGVVTDVLSGGSRIAGSSHVYTDGSWAWQGELAYYVENYHLVLPFEFVSYMAANNWKVPDNIDVTEIDL